MGRVCQISHNYYPFEVWYCPSRLPSGRNYYPRRWMGKIGTRCSAFIEWLFRKDIFWSNFIHELELSCGTVYRTVPLISGYHPPSSSVLIWLDCGYKKPELCLIKKRADIVKFTALSIHSPWRRVCKKAVQKQNGGFINPKTYKSLNSQRTN